MRRPDGACQLLLSLRSASCTVPGANNRSESVMLMLRVEYMVRGKSSFGKKKKKKGELFSVVVVEEFFRCYGSLRED